jgi:hypothetical protein
MAKRKNVNSSSTSSHHVSASVNHHSPKNNTNLWLEYFVDVEDVGILHLIALANPEVTNERIFGYAEPFDFNQMLAIFRKNFPDRKFHEDFPGIGKDISTIAPRERAIALLKEFGRDGFRSFEESLLMNVESISG